jgi:hypothetical protein
MSFLRIALDQLPFAKSKAGHAVEMSSRQIDIQKRRSEL